MSYPVWDVPVLGGGLVVAIIAVVHVLISHLAIGGGAFLFLAEVWSNRDAAGERIREWLHRYATFFVIFTTVFGAVTGVGIWFAIQLANPEATSLLIHQFVFAWATEWVMFIGELTVLFLYYYGWRHNSRRMQLFLAGAYFVIAWLSLFIINGILTFMLTPGGWTLENPDIALGFFNPGFLPALLLRTAVMFVLAGLAGILVSARLGEEEAALKSRIVRFSTAWVVPAALLVPPLVLWYWLVLPPGAVTLVLGGVVGLSGGKLEGMTRALWLAGTAGGLVVLGALAAAFRARAVSTGGGIALLLVVLLGIAGGEFFREMARKPYVVRDVLYSNGLWQADVAKGDLGRVPFLERARWHPGLLGRSPADAGTRAAGAPRPIEPLSVEHGAWLFRTQCASCHTRDGYRAITKRTASWTPDFGYRFFTSMHEQGVMPPFAGVAEDRAALTAYLLSLNGVEASSATILGQARGGRRTEEATP